MSKLIIRAISKQSIYVLCIAAIVSIGVLLYVGAISSKKDALSTSNAASEYKKNKYDAYAAIANADILEIGASGEFAWDLRDPYYFYNKLPIAALVHIDSIDGGRNYSPIFEQYVYPQTIGKMTVLEVYKGDIKVGQQLGYSRLGGIISYEDYWKGLNDAQRDKILHLNNGTKPTSHKYVHEKFDEDIDIVVDKNYIVFLQPQTSKDGKYTEYAMNGMQWGLRETKGSGADTMILNNKTKQWDSVSSIVKKKN